MAAIRVFFRNGNDQAQISFDHLRLGLIRPGKGKIQLGAVLEKIIAAHTDKALECPNFVFFGLEGCLLRGGFALGLILFDGAQTRLNFVPDILRDQGHFIEDPMLEMKSGRYALELFVQAFELAQEPRTLRAGSHQLPRSEFIICLQVEGARALDQPTHRLQMPFAVR